MEKVIIIHYGEIALKGNNRWIFEKKLIDNIKTALKDSPYLDIRKISGRILIFLPDDFDRGKFIFALSHVFGIVNFSFAWKTETEVEAMEKSLEEILRRRLKEKPANTFRVSAKRSDKTFPLTSEEVNRRVGEYIFEKTDLNLKVKLVEPDMDCRIEIADGSALVYLEKIKGAGGLPAGVSGKVVSLLSSGFDSPVAAWQLMRRGAEAVFVHFHSYPRTSRASIDNVKNIVKILNNYQFYSTLYLVPLLDIQKEILTKAPADYRIVLYRRMMFRLAERIALENKAKALVTGESLGQVASQTLENINVIGEVVKLPIFRPLIGSDKEEIMNSAKKIGTYDISKTPYEDCCSLFVPRHPATKARISDVEKMEKNFDIENLLKDAIAKIEMEKFNWRIKYKIFYRLFGATRARGTFHR